MGYVQWGRKTCTNGHATQYYGLIMADHYSYKKSEYICVDWDRAPHMRSSNSNHNGGLLYTTEMQTNGHSSGDEQQYVMTASCRARCVLRRRKSFALTSRI